MVVLIQKHLRNYFNIMAKHLGKVGDAKARKAKALKAKKKKEVKKKKK